MSKLIDIPIPDIGDFDTVDVIEVLVAVGDTVKAEQSLITVESDKSSMEIPSNQGGVVKAVLVKIGDKVKQGSVILQLEASAEAGTAGDVAVSASSSPATAASANASTLSWRFRSWFLASPTLITNSTTFYAATGSSAANVVDTALNTGKSWTVSCTSANNNGSNYTYIIYPSSYGNLSGVVQDGATPVLGAFLSGTSPIDVTILNQYGRTQTIRIYRSNAFGAFSDGTSLAIS